MKKSKKRFVIVFIFMSSVLFLSCIPKKVIISDPYLEYLKSTSHPNIFVEKSLQDGNGGTVKVALERSFYDPNCNPPTDYTTLTTPGNQYAIDVMKVKDNTDTWHRVMSDNNQDPLNPIADGYDDGLGNASSLYDNALAVISLTHAGEITKAQEIMDGFKKTVKIMLDDDKTGAAHPGGSISHPIKDQAEDFSAFACQLIGICFDKYKESSSPPNETYNAGIDQQEVGYPRISPGHEFGIWINQPINPTWAGVDDQIDSPRVSEFNDILDNDDPGIASFAPYLENNYYYRAFWPYRMWLQWLDCDAPETVGSENNAQQMKPDKLIPYSPYWTKHEYTYRDYTASVGDSLWMVLAMLYYTDKQNDVQYLDTVYGILDTIADNLQDFNGGIHFGYYAIHEITATATEHNIDWIFVWNWIDKLHSKGKIDDEHWNRYKAVTEGNLVLNPGDIKILSITDNSSDDDAVIGADYMLKFLGIPHSILETIKNATVLNLANVKVLILPETPITNLSYQLRHTIYNFATSGGCIFGTCAAVLNIDNNYNPFGVSMSTIQAVGDASHPIDYYGRNIVLDKVYKDGRDNAAFKIDSDFDGICEDTDADEPSEADNWEEGAGNLNYAYKASPPYDYFLLWSAPDYKRSRLTSYLMDIGDEWHALNGGHTPDLLGGESRTTNSGNAITCDRYAKNPTNYGANDYGFITMLRAKIDLDGVSSWSESYNYNPNLTQEMLYFYEPSTSTTSKGKTIYFAGDIFGFFKKIIYHDEVNGVKYSPYRSTYIEPMSSQAQVLENVLTWFFTPGLDPVYATHDPYGSNTVYADHLAGEKGHFDAPLSSSNQKFGSSTTNPGKSVTVFDVDYATVSHSGKKCIKMTKNNTETYAGMWLTKNIDFGTFDSMTCGLGQGENLNGSTKLTFWAKAEATNPNVNCTFSFGISSGINNSDSYLYTGYNVNLSTYWVQYTINISTTVDLGHLNGLFSAKINSANSNTIYLDDIHYEPRVYGYNDETLEGHRTIYREGRNNEGIWSGWMGDNNGSSLVIDKHWTIDPYYGYRCFKITRNSSESWAGIFVQQLGYSPDENVRWSYGPGIGANLGGVTSLSFWVKSDNDMIVKFGYGYGTTDFPDDSSHQEIWAELTSTGTWTQYTINIPPATDMSHINGLFFFSTNDTGTFYLDNITYNPVGKGTLLTYDDDIEAKNQETYLWRNKKIKHLGVQHFLENCVWADANDYMRLAPGIDKPSRDDDVDGKPDDWVYEKDWSASGSDWPIPFNWTRKKMFIRGQLDFTKAADLGTWGAIYWLESPSPSIANTQAVLDFNEDVFMTNIQKTNNNHNMCLRQAKNVTASSIIASGFEADKAFDDDNATRWTSASSDPQWIKIDLGRAEEVQRVRLDWESSSIYDDEYNIEYSTNNIDWQPAYSANGASGQHHTIDLPTPVASRYWRMYGIHRASGWGHSLWEFKLYGYDKQDSLEYWDVHSEDIDDIQVGDDFGDAIWPEGIGQLAQAYEFAQDNYHAQKHLSVNETVAYIFSGGQKGVPYSWPKNNIVEKRGPGWGDDIEREDALSIAATCWTYMAKNRVNFFAKANMPSAPINLALKRKAKASSSKSLCVKPKKAIDGKLETCWTSKYSDPQWIRVDLGSPKAITQVVLYWEGGTNNIYDNEYKIEYSNNGSNWTEAFYTDKATGTIHNIPIPNITARYWRMYGYHRANGYGHSLREFEIYGE